MHDLIETFLCVGRCGSFSAASQELYLTANGVKKRIGLLESRTGVVLFERSNKGEVLTAAGRSFYDDCLRVSEGLSLSVQRAREIQQNEAKTVRIGMMSTFSDSFTSSPWENLRREDMIGRSRICYYGSSIKEMGEMFADVGARIDLCVDIYDEDVAKRYGLRAKKLSEYSIVIGLPRPPHGGEGDALDLLRDMRVALLPEGRSAAFDRARGALGPVGRLVDIPDFSIKTLNDCYMKNAAVVCAENLTNIFPFYRFVPLVPETRVSYGIYYRERASAEAEIFLKSMRPAP